MNADCRMPIAECRWMHGNGNAISALQRAKCGRSPIRSSIGNRQSAIGISLRSSIGNRQSAIGISRRRSAAALTLIEILIAMFIFLVGCLGVLSVFPVAINNAGRVLGETRGNVLAQSVVGQVTADCRVNFELPATGSAAAVTPQAPAAPVNSSLTRVPGSYYSNPPPLSPSSKTGYFVTLLDGPGRGQSRFITTDPANWSSTMIVTPAWTQVPIAVMAGNPPVLTQTGPNWTGPGSLAVPSGTNPWFPNEHYSITRMGLPERPLLAGEQILQGQPTTLNSVPPPSTPYYVYQPVAPYTYGSFGLNRDLVVRSYAPVSGSNVPAPANGFFAGIANPFDVQNSAVQVDPFVAYCGQAQTLPTYGQAGAPPAWTINSPYSVGAVVSVQTPAINYYCISPNTSAQSPPNSNWQNAVYYTLYDFNQSWPIAPSPQLSSNYQVRIVGGTGAGQVRTITSSTAHLLTVTPSWSVPPDTTSIYEIGWANTSPANQPPPDNTPCQNATWCAQLYPKPPPLGPPGAACNINPNVLNMLNDASGANWNTNQFAGKYVYITTAGESQARAIVSNTANTLTVTPAFTIWGNPLNYIITESYGYVLITSGRATNRLFPIAWDAVDPPGTPYANCNGHLIVCAGTNFESLTAITAAQKINTNFTNLTTTFPPGYSYNLQDATTFTVIGNYSQSQLTWPVLSSPPLPPYTTPVYPSTPLILNAVPDGSPIPTPAWTPPAPPVPPFCPPWFNTMNVVNILTMNAQDQEVQTNQFRLALDQFNVSTQGGGSYTSEYSYGVIFSDSGVDPSLPVRVDVLVWRNFDTTKDFIENLKPVGHMAGYIKRP